MQIVSLTVPQKITALAIFIGIVAIIVFVLIAAPTDAPRTSVHPNSPPAQASR